MRKILNQAAAQFAKGNISGAERLYSEVLEQDPNNASAYWGLGRIAMQALKYHDAIGLFESATRLLPSHPLPLVDMAKAYDGLRKFDLAGGYFQKAAEIAPDNAYAQYAYGVHLSEAGEVIDAETRFRNAIRLDPANAYAFYELSKLKLFSSSEDEDLKAIEKLLTRSNISASDLIAAHFALGKAYDDIGDVNRALENFAKANALQHAEVSFSVEDMKPFFEDVKRVFGSEFFSHADPATDQPLTPVFIVGMPRSGSSLLEAMLGGHSEIFAAGELPYLPRDVVGALARESKKPFPHACASLQSSDCQRLALTYFDRVQSCAPGFRYVTDKLPANFQSVGLIKKLMPGAKIINLRRNPMDVGLSIFKNFFNENEPYFCDLSEIGEYHKLYQDLMAHWRRHAPGFVLDVDYEDLVADPKSVIGGVFEFCGLELQDACLTPAQQSGHVRTLSSHQVRRTVNTDSIGSWRAYEKHLQPLKRALA